MWVKPGANSYKLNIDACFFPNGTGATGAVLRDDKGQAVAGASFIWEHLLDATTEAIALQKGLQLIEDLGCSLVVIESDSLELVQAYNGVIEVWSAPLHFDSC
jgi:ribonuclease HI